jgi:hypothetical protein
LKIDSESIIKMRLTEFEIKALVDTTAKVFDRNTHLILFGSRVNNNARGGDIDLLLIPGENVNNDLFNRKIHYLIEVKNILGDQKIDLIIQKSDDTRGIIFTAKQNGIILC